MGTSDLWGWSSWDPKERRKKDVLTGGQHHKGDKRERRPEPGGKGQEEPDPGDHHTGTRLSSIDPLLAEEGCKNLVSFPRCIPSCFCGSQRPVIQQVNPGLEGMALLLWSPAFSPGLHMGEEDLGHHRGSCWELRMYSCYQKSLLALLGTR